MYDVNLDYLEIVAGTTNHIHPAYLEAAKNLNEYNNKGAAALKGFLEDIEELASQSGVREKRIADSKGNIRNCAGYKDLNTCLSFLKKNLGKVEGVAECDKLLGALERYIPQYENGYSKQVRLIMLEYESAVYILFTYICMAMSSKLEIVADGEIIKIKQAENKMGGGVIDKTLRGMADIVSKPEHKEYLEDLCKASEEVASKKEIKEYVDFTESAVSEGLALFDAIMTNVTRIFKGIGTSFTMLKRTMFGIIPLIRSCIYLRYKRKADTIAGLEAQAAFIERNIEQLENRTNMDPKKKEKIIKKQRAAAEAAMKRAAKMRAQLLETEKDTSKALEDHNKDISRTNKKDKTSSPSAPKTQKEEKKEEPKKNPDDDLVLEWVMNAFPIGGES